ncbi:MAG: hypothetical protein IKI93_14905 [Clostridia bacterium]|nr:hypothetical protein [Clostridia bacterium]
MGWGFSLILLTGRDTIGWYRLTSFCQPNVRSSRDGRRPRHEGVQIGRLVNCTVDHRPVDSLTHRRDAHGCLFFFCRLALDKQLPLRYNRINRI